MSEQNTDVGAETTPEQNIEGEQVVVNNAPDGGGVDNNEADAAPESDAPAESNSDSDGDSEATDSE